MPKCEERNELEKELLNKKELELKGLETSQLVHITKNNEAY